MSMLTPRQRQALSLDRHLCVTANAGSGKTRVLVERYMRLVLDGHASVREIVALTFTEKAASELRSRIAGHLQEALRQGPPPPRRAALEEVRAHLASAWIGTIHSFCARLLREYPVEAGVDAAFGVVEGLDQRLLLRESIRTAFSRLLKEEGDSAAHTALIETVRLLGKPAMFKLVTRVVEHRETWDRWHQEGGLYARGDEAITAYWDSAIDAFVLGALSSDELRRDLERLAASADGKGADGLQQLWGEFCAATGAGDQARVFSEILTKALTTSGDLARRVAGTAADGLLDVGHRLSRWRRDLLPLLHHVWNRSEAGAHALLLATSRSVLRVAGEAMDIYAGRKQDAGQLDFEDLQLSMRRLLRRAEVAQPLAERFRYFLVDEFQDTNRLQYEILLPLVQHLQRGNLFIVGDPKQSIYRFRNANVAVFQEARQAIIESSGATADIILEESFRPLRDLVAFINRVFGRLMGEHAVDFSPLTAMEVSYEPLVQARAGSHSGRVDLLLMDPDAPGEGAEAALLARRILHLRSSAFPVTGADDCPRPMRFGDVAILLRNRTLLPEVEQALAQYAIPFVVSAGTGYFQTQDVLDFYNFLRVLLRPSDDAALVGVLRSPFFAVSDAELFEACMDRRTGSVWEHLHVRGAHALSGTLLQALQRLEEVRSRAATLTVPETLALIVTSTMYESKLRGIPGGDQALANLEKLRALARRSHLPGFLTLHDFVDRLGQLIDQEEHEGQGAIELSGDAVQVMTIHAAKGLEFPVVAVPFLHRPLRLDTQPFVDEFLGLAFDFEDREGHKTPIPVTLLSREVSRRRTVAEEKRIAYVAFTRGRDALLLSGAPAAMKGMQNALAWILQAFDLDPASPAGVVERPAELEVLSLVNGVLVREKVHHTHRLVLQRPADVAQASVGSLEPAVPVRPPRFLTGAVEPSPVKEFLSATRLRVYRECPRLYYLRYIVGYPGLSPIQAPADQDELTESRIVPGAFGRAFHAVMESIDRLQDDADAIREEAVRALGLDQEIDPRLAGTRSEEVTRAVLDVVGSSTWQRIVQGSESRTEFTISAPLGGDYMVGTMDRIFRDRDGVWHLLDYKTDSVAPGRLPERAREYLPQLQFYAVLLSEYFATSPVRATLLFSAFPEKPLRYEFFARDLQEIQREILGDMERIRSRNFPPATPTCSQCPLRPAGCLASHT
jgi:ATP-dependent helicase/nuclease subunit A